MKIIKFEAENVKRLQVVTITPDGNTVVLKGANGAGKSSVLDAIEMALAGKTSRTPAEVIRRGERNASVTVDLGEYTVTRRWTKTGSTLEVRSPEGSKLPSPQALLDSIVGKLSFDPLGFNRLDPKKKVEVLRAVTGADFAELDATRRQAYDQRTLVNRDLEQASARLKAAPPVPGVDPDGKESSLEELLRERAELQSRRDENEAIRTNARIHKQKVSICQEKLQTAQKRVEELSNALAEAQKEAFERRRILDEAERLSDDTDARLSELVDPDFAEVDARLKGMEAENARLRAAKHRRDLECAVRDLRNRVSDLTKKIERVDAEKEHRLAETKVPVPGLSFSEDGVLFDGLPLEQASASQQLRVSMAMGLALNPKLKVVLVREGCLLDEDSLAEVARMADEAGAQVWVERVGRGGVGILIEDGCVAQST